MSKKKSISLIVIVAIICSVLSSLLTVVIVNKTGILNGTTSTSQGTSSKIVVSSDKSTNVYQAVSEKAKPSVVGITTTTISSDNMFSMPTESTGVGTGIIVDSNGYILTNSHVISDGKAKSVNVLFKDGSSIDGHVLWYDSQLDLAIVKVNKTGLTAAELGDSDKVQIGDISIAIGNPYGLDLAGTVTQGIISGLDRTISTEETTMTGLIQTDASINAGNSGGPLLNSSGEVIGINTAKASEGEGLGFSIPINTAKPIIESIIKNDIYNSLIPENKTLKDIKIIDYFPAEIINNLQEKLLEKDKQLSSLKTLLQDISKDYDKSSEEIKSIKDTLETKENLIIEYKEKIDTLTSLVTEYREYKEDYLNLKSKYESSLQKNSDIQYELKELRLEKSNLEKTIEIINNQLQEYKDNINQIKLEHKESIAEKNNEINKMQKDFEEHLLKENEKLEPFIRGRKSSYCYKYIILYYTCKTNSILYIR